MANKKSTDWKRILSQQDTATPTPPRELLTAFTRTSVGNDGKFNNLNNLPTDKDRMDAVLAMMEGNRKLHSMAKKKTSYNSGLKGLFGGG